MTYKEYYGQFRLADNQDRKVWGKVRINEDNIVSLQLYDIIDPDYKDLDDVMRKPNSFYDRDYILGELVNGESVVLFNTTRQREEVFPKLSYVFNVFGILYYNPRDDLDIRNVSFHRVRFTTTFLHELIGHDVTEFEVKDGGDFLIETRINQGTADTFDLNGDQKLSILHYYHCTHKPNLSTIIENQTFLELEFTNAMSLKEIAEDYLKPICIFLSFVTGQYLAPEDIKLFPSTESKLHNQDMRVAFSIFGNPKNQPKKPLLVLHDLVKDDFGDIVDNFTILYKKNPAIFNMIYYGVYKDEPIMEYSFMSVVGAIDSLLKDKYIDSTEFENEILKPYQLFIESLEYLETKDELKTWLNKALDTKNTKSLTDRISAFISKGNEFLPNAIVTNGKKTAHRIVYYRNILTHVNDDKRNEKFYTKFYPLWHVACCILDALVMEKIGCKEETICNILGWKYTYIR